MTATADLPDLTTTAAGDCLRSSSRSAGAPTMRTVTSSSHDPKPAEASDHHAKPAGALERSIGEQVKQFRQSLGLTASDLAERTGLSKAMISKIESASTSSSLTTVERLAHGLGVPVTALFRGLESDREASHTRSGEGAVVVRSGTRRGHEYRILGSLRHREDALEPTLVTLTSTSDVFPLFQHPGTEFLYMLEGEMVYTHGPHQYRMQPGDSLLFEGEAPHGPAELVSVPIRFLAIADPHPGPHTT